MATEQDSVQQARIAFSELAGGELELAAFEAQAKRDVAYWLFMTEQYKKFHGKEAKSVVETEVATEEPTKGAKIVRAIEPNRKDNGSRHARA